MAVVTILTAFSADMLIYDEGNVYSCPVDHLNSYLTARIENDDEGKYY